MDLLNYWWYDRRALFRECDRVLSQYLLSREATMEAGMVNYQRLMQPFIA